MSDSEGWEDESTVVIKLNGIIEDDWISHFDGDCKMIGIETEEPIFQFGRYMFSGEHTQAKGTNLLFSQKGAGYKFEEHTFTELKMTRMFLKARTKDNQENEDKQSTMLDYISDQISLATEATSTSENIDEGPSSSGTCVNNEMADKSLLQKEIIPENEDETISKDHMEDSD